MKTMMRNFYIFGIMVAITMALGLFWQFHYFYDRLNEETKINTALSRDIAEKNVGEVLESKAAVIIRAANYIIRHNRDEDALLTYFKKLMHDHPCFYSIYFVNTDDQMINGSGWIMPDNFDFKAHPWYAKAMKEQAIIFTEVFFNASKDRTIITIAQPIYDDDHKFLGVIAGDVDIEKIVTIIRDVKVGRMGYSFLIDGKGKILAHPHYHYELGGSLKSMSEISPAIAQQITQHETDLVPATLEGVSGYLAYRPVAHTDWIIGCFIPMHEYMQNNIQYIRVFGVTMIITMLIFAFWLVMQKRNIVTPILNLERDVQTIDMENQTNYRVPLIPDDPLNSVRRSINIVLDQTQQSFDQLEAEEEKLRTANDKLASAVEQLEITQQELEIRYQQLAASEDQLAYLSYRDQLTGLYNRRYFEMELARLNTPAHYPLSIIMADVNGLKLVNDSFGHAVGDELLQKAARVLTKDRQAMHAVARIGGDEFVVLLPHTDEYAAREIVKYMKNLSSQQKVGSVELSISFGFGTITGPGETIEETLKNVEDYMYKTKLFEGPSMRSKTIGAIINTLHEKNRREEQHSRRVAELSISMGEALDFSEDKIQELGTVGLLHDIGKVAIAENILEKPGKLTQEEWREIQRHPEIGYRILSTVSELAEISQYVLAHHERWDGRGYPRGLKGDQIPDLARIIAVADTYDAMTSPRPYRAALSHQVAVEEIQRNAGSQFDPHIVRVFVEKAALLI